MRDLELSVLAHAHVHVAALVKIGGLWLVVVVCVGGRDVHLASV